MTRNEIEIKVKELYSIAEDLKCTAHDELFYCAEILADYARTIAHIAEDYVPQPSHDLP